MSAQRPRSQAVSSAEELTARRGRQVILDKAAQIEPQPIDWLWRGWLSAGKLHLLAGAPSTGKTTIALDLAATLTQGGQWPDGTQASPRNVVMWTSEDDVADTLVPRLIAAGANRDRVFFVGAFAEGGRLRAFDPSRDLLDLSAQLRLLKDVGLLILDPIVSVVGGDSHKNAEVRRALDPVLELAASSKCAVLGITHFSKGTSGLDTVERITGSLAFGALARVIWVTARRPSDEHDDLRILARAKSNVGPDGGGFTYRVRSHILSSDPEIETSAVSWQHAVEGTANDLLSPGSQSSNSKSKNMGSSLEVAKRWLTKAVEVGPRLARELKEASEGEGISRPTLHRAKRELGLWARRAGTSSYWFQAADDERMRQLEKEARNAEGPS